MTVLMVVVCGFLTGSGLLLIALGLAGVPLAGAGGGDFAGAGAGAGPGADGTGDGSRFLARARGERPRVRLALAALGGGALWLLTGWPVGVLLAAVIGLMAPSLIGAKARRREAIERTEAIAAWAEQLRDTISAAAGLQEAVAITARVAPMAIRPAVVELATGMRRSSLSVELQRMADRLDDPIADQVVVALVLAAERRGEDLSRLLGDLADGARADATMRIRTETSRAQTYNDAKVVTGVVVGMFCFLLVVNRAYLDAFDSLTGQIVLAVIGVLWVLALHGISVLSEVRRPPRILRLSPPGAGPQPFPGGSSAPGLPLVTLVPPADRAGEWGR